MSPQPRRSVCVVRPAVALLALTLLVGGCTTPSEPVSQAQADATMNAWTLGPLVDEHGHHRSLALDSPEMAELHEIQPWLTMGEPWYAGRVDRSRQITHGTKVRGVDRVLIATRDRIEGSDGEVNDDFRLQVRTQRTFERRP